VGAGAIVARVQPCRHSWPARPRDRELRGVPARTSRHSAVPGPPAAGGGGE